MAQFINDPTLPKPTFPGSHMVVDDHYAFVSGLTIADIVEEGSFDADVGKQTHRIMRELERMLRQEALEWRDVVRVDVHLTDLSEIRTFDSVYAEFFDAGQYPARTCTEASRLCGGSNVEITLMASLGRRSATKDTPEPDADTGPE